MMPEALGTPRAWRELPDRPVGPDAVRIRIEACGVCRTGPHVVDGELPDVRVAVPEPLLLGTVR